MKIRQTPELLLLWGFWAFVLLAAATALTSCSMSSHLVKDIEKTKTEAKTTTNVSTIDHVVSHITTTEVVDTTLKIPQNTNEGMKSLSSITAGDPLVIDNPDQTSVVSYDPATKTINVKTTVKPRDILVNKTKTSDADITADTKQNVQKVVDSTSNTEKRSVNRQMEAHNYFFLYLGIGIVILLVIVWFLRKQIPFVKNFFV